MQKGASRGPAGPRMPKLPALQDFQFFDTARITELHEKQCAYDMYMHERKKEAQEKAGPSSHTLSPPAGKSLLRFLSPDPSQIYSNAS